MEPKKWILVKLEVAEDGEMYKCYKVHTGYKDGDVRCTALIPVDRVVGLSWDHSGAVEWRMAVEPTHEISRPFPADKPLPDGWRWF